MNTTEAELRPIEIKNGLPYPAGGSLGYFHGWCKEPFFNDSGPFLTKTFALVELADGNVALIEPNLIRFKKPIGASV
ncbi:MAG TPA: hypothetical protein VGQ59_01855 [Cyclobacteriaceae bacterium]|nr:hypothetical protein [Cyclobacteriaceae bacterium]